MSESCHTYEWVTSHNTKRAFEVYISTIRRRAIWMRHVTHVNESCHMYEWVTAQTCMQTRMHMRACLICRVATSSSIDQKLPSRLRKQDVDVHTFSWHQRMVQMISLQQFSNNFTSIFSVVKMISLRYFQTNLWHKSILNFIPLFRVRSRFWIHSIICLASSSSKT